MSTRQVKQQYYKCYCFKTQTASSRRRRKLSSLRLGSRSTLTRHENALQTEGIRKAPAFRFRLVRKNFKTKYPVLRKRYIKCTHNMRRFENSDEFTCLFKISVSRKWYVVCNEKWKQFKLNTWKTAFLISSRHDKHKARPKHWVMQLFIATCSAFSTPSTT